MNALVWVIIGIVILAGWGMLRDGSDTPSVQSTIESGKIVVEKGKYIYDLATNEETNLTEIGRPVCVTNVDCNVLADCEGDLCICSEGSCYK